MPAQRLPQKRRRPCAPSLGRSPKIPTSTRTSRQKRDGFSTQCSSGPLLSNRVTASACPLLDCAPHERPWEAALRVVLSGVAHLGNRVRALAHRRPHEIAGELLRLNVQIERRNDGIGIV